MFARILMFALSFMLLIPSIVQANTQFPDKQAFNSQNLVLNGKGVRTKVFFNLYTAGLYVSAPTRDAAALLAGQQAMALRMEITSGMITSEKMESAVRDGFAQSVTDTEPLQARIEQLIEAFKEPIAEGDVYDFIYQAQNTLVVKNGISAASIEGADFANALFGIWIGSKPVQASLKSALLGAKDDSNY